MFSGQSNFLQALGWALLNSLWQMALLWVVYQLYTGIIRQAKPAAKSRVASVFVLGGFSWFLYTFITLFFSDSSADSSFETLLINSNNGIAVNNWLMTMLPIASVIYLGILVLPVFNFVRNYRYVQAIRQQELSKIDVQWRIFVQKVAARMGITKSVNIWLSGIVTSPVTVGFVKPVILLPLAAVNHLSTQQIEAVLLHELAHIRRSDYLLNLLTRFIQAILYFNPFVTAFVKIIEREREKSCDDMVMQFQYDPYGYATALLTLEKTNHFPKPLAVAAGGRKNDLLHRIECVLGVKQKRVFTFDKLAGILGGLLCFIVLNALLIMRKPANTETSVASLTHLSSPFYVFTGDEPAENTNAPIERPAHTIINNIAANEVKAKPVASPVHAEIATQPYRYDYAYSNPVSNLFLNVALNEMNQPAAPKLKEYQEVQVKQAIEASRKVIEEKQWKAVESTIADVMTTYEKSVVKSEYDKEMSQVDWKRMEDKLRLAYDRIEWSKVNEELNKAVAEIKMDSLNQVYSQAMVELTSLQKQLAENNLKGIPDTDISLKAVEQGKLELQRAINTIKNIKTRKIVQL